MLKLLLFIEMASLEFNKVFTLDNKFTWLHELEYSMNWNLDFPINVDFKVQLKAHFSNPDNYCKSFACKNNTFEMNFSSNFS